MARTVIQTHLLPPVRRLTHCSSARRLLALGIADLERYELIDPESEAYAVVLNEVRGEGTRLALHRQKQVGALKTHSH